MKRHLTSQQLEAVQLNLIALVGYASRVDAGELPFFFRTCKGMIRYIDDCRDEGYITISDVTQMLVNDWKSIRNMEGGIGEYYIDSPKVSVQIAANSTFGKQVEILDGLLAIDDADDKVENGE